MSLDFREKRRLQKVVAEQQTALRSGLGFQAKRQAQKLMRESLAKLGAGAAPQTENPALALLRAVLSGEHDGLGLGRLLDMIEGAVVALNQGGDLVGDNESLADSAITHWARLEEVAPGGG